MKFQRTMLVKIQKKTQMPPILLTRISTKKYLENPVENLTLRQRMDKILVQMDKELAFKKQERLIRQSQPRKVRLSDYIYQKYFA